MCTFKAIASRLIFAFVGTLCFCALSRGIALADPGTGAALDIDNSKLVVVSMGDSFSSGEGCPPFYGSRFSKKASGDFRDWVAHRSTDSWPGRLKIGTGDSRITLADHKDTNWFFVASSGAESEHVYARKQTKKFTRESLAQKTKLPKQDYVFSSIQATGADVDYVTLTMGGNDIGFSNTITSMYLYHFDPSGPWAAIREGWQKYYDGYTNKQGKFEKPARETIAAAYRDIREKAGNQASVVVAGYPHLVSEKGCIHWPDSYAGMLNRNVDRFDDELKMLVAEQSKQEGSETGGFRFVDARDVFAGKEAYTTRPWINKVMLLSRLEDIKIDFASAYSMHPNHCGEIGCGVGGPDCGISAYKSIMQEAIDGIEQEREERQRSDVADAPFDLSDKSDYEQLNRYLSEFGMVGLSEYDTETDTYTPLDSWEHGELPEKSMVEFAVEYCSKFGGDAVERADGGDWEMGPGGSAEGTCNMRVHTTLLNDVISRYFGIAVDFTNIDYGESRTVGDYYYWGVTAPATQDAGSLTIATDVEHLGGYDFRISFDFIKTPDLYDLFEDGSKYYSLASDEAHRLESATVSTSGSAIIRYKPSSEEKLELMSWSVPW